MRRNPATPNPKTIRATHTKQYQRATHAKSNTNVEKQKQILNHKKQYKHKTTQISKFKTSAPSRHNSDQSYRMKLASLKSQPYADQSYRKTLMIYSFRQPYVTV